MTLRASQMKLADESYENETKPRQHDREAQLTRDFTARINPPGF
jgi:hypothetical protein